MSHPTQNKTQVVYNNKVGLNTQKPVYPNNPAQFQRYTMQPAQKTKINVGNPNNYYQNMGYENINKYNSGNIKSSYNNQLIDNDIYDEVYTIDPHTKEKIFLKTKNQVQSPKLHAYANAPVNDTYLMAPQKGQKVNLENIDNITSSIDPSYAYQRSQEVNNQNITPIIENYNINGTTIFPQRGISQDYPVKNKEFDPKQSASSLTVSSLANIPYHAYPAVQFSREPFFNISGFGLNSYNGKVKKFNEDRIKAIVNYQNPFNIKISYFSIFDGHSGNKCSDYLKENLHKYIFNSKLFPSDIPKAIRESFKKADETFKAMVYDQKNNVLKDKSGSCALVMLILNNYLYAINLGDSRALYSYDTGKYLYQITRDHKPNDEIEKRRIEKAGGKVFYANTVNRNGKEIELKEEDFGKGFTFPYRISPGKIAVSLIIIIYNINNNLGSKNYWRLLCQSPITWRIRWGAYF